MILTTCAACAKPIAHDASSRCVGCQTRYCSDRCLRYHAHRGGHDDECEDIANGGGAEQYHANKKYEEAVTDAVEECAEDTEGQTCYICLGGDAEEGLVRGCSCRGGAGFAHVSCLAKQAKILVAEAEERWAGPGDDRAVNARWARWHSCRLCEQAYHGIVRCALGWACWKTYVGRPETNQIRGMAMNLLGNGLGASNRNEDALPVQEAELARKLRLGDSESNILIAQGNLAITYRRLGRFEEALSMRQEVYSGRLKLDGEERASTLIAANNYAQSFHGLKRFEEAKALLRKTLPIARRVLGEGCDITLLMRTNSARALYKDTGATLDDLREAVETLEDAGRIARRVMGGTHPITLNIEDELQDARDALHAQVHARGLP